MKKRLPSPAARQFAVMALTGCASVSAAYAAQTLRYNFEAVNDPASDPVINLAPGATQNGTFANPGKVSVTNNGEEVQVNAVRYLLGKTAEFFNVDSEEGTAGHVNTGLNPSGWGIANNNTMNRSYTVMAWVKFGSTAGDNMVFGQLEGDALHLGSRNGNLHSGHWGDDIGPDQGFSVPTGTGTWQHVAWVNNVNAQSIYRNGALVVGPGATGASGGNVGNMLIATFRNNGSFIGSIDEVKVFSDQVLTAAEIQTEMTNTLTPVPLAVVTSAKLNNSGFTFTIKDFIPNSVVNPATVTLEIDGSPVTPTSSTKVGDTTTVTYQPVLPDLAFYGSTSSHTYTLSAKDQSNPAIPNITGTGNLLMPVLPAVLPGPSGTTTSWGVREHRAPVAMGTIGVAVDTLAALPAADDDPGTNTIFDGAAPVMNHVDPVNPGSRGNFNNDLPFIGGTTGVEDNNIAFTGKTQVVIPAAGSYTFSVHTDDGFALRISGGPVGNTSRFTSSNRNTATNGIDVSDPQTIFFSGGSADSNTTGVYNFTAPGTYDVLMVAYEGGGGAYYELAWAPGAFQQDYQTATWSLVGNPNDPTVLAVPYTLRFPAVIPGISGGDNTWGVRTFYNATTGSTVATANWLAATGINLPPDEVSVFDRQRPILNMSDNRDAATQALQNTGSVAGDYPLPGTVGVSGDGVSNVAHSAKGRILVTTPGVYTFNARGDDGFFLRIKAVSGPNPQFTRVSHPDPNNGEPRLDMSNLNEIWYAGGTGDTNTRGIITLAAGQYDIEYINWQGAGGAWHELTAAQGAFPHGTEPPSGWQAVGFFYPAPPASQQPVISPAGWTVTSAPDGSLLAFSIAGAEAALTANGTVSNWDAVNFMDPQSAGGPASIAPATAWPRNTPNDDNNYAMKATAQLIVSSAATYRLGYQGDDGGYFIIRGTGGNPSPSFETALLENLTGAGVVEAEDPINNPTILNKLRTEVGTGNSRTIGRITLQPGTYQLETLFYEGGGGSYWGVVGAIEPIDTTSYFPLTKGGLVPAFSGLTLVAPVIETIPVTDFAYNPANGNFSITFASTAGTNYQLDYSTAMTTAGAGDPATWNASPSGPTAGIAGTTTITGNISSLQPGNGGVLPVGSPRLFLRVRRL